MLTACGTSPVGPDYVLPPQAAVNAPAAQGAFIGAADDDTARAAFAETPLPPHWWRLYRDATLDELIARALAHNADLRVAMASLEREQALLRETQGAQSPTLAVSAGETYGHVSGLSLLQKNYTPDNDYHYSGALSLSYQLDMFGQIRRAIESAQAGSEAAQAALDLARVNVVAATTRAYAQICAGNLRLRTAQRSVSLQEEAVSVSMRLQQAGRAGATDIARARGQLNQLKAALPPLLAERQGALYRLATLTGNVPREAPVGVEDCAAPPRLQGLIPVGDGTALLRRRPDIRQAERQLAAATARIGVVTADLYPKVTLGLAAGSIGPVAGFARGDTTSWSLGPLISWTLPNSGAVQARIAQAEAGTRLALAHFDGTVQTALRETETALATYARELDRRAALQAARDDSATVAEQARALYRNGKTGYLEALDAERTLASSEAALATSDAQLADDQAVLFLALGGGWEASSTQATR
ncbi:MAG: TolC family protein [Rhodocyclaceae bacterium]